MYVNIGASSKNAKRFSTILGTRACSNFMRISELPPPLRDCIKPLEGFFTIINASEKTVPVVGLIVLVVQVGTSQSTMNFLVTTKIATEVILGCDY